jgi:hypothetical protein
MDKSRKGQSRGPDSSLSHPENIYNRLEEDEDDDDDSMVDAGTGHEIHRHETADETSLMTLVGDVQDKVCFLVVSVSYSRCIWIWCETSCRKPTLTFSILIPPLGRHDRWMPLILGGC